MGQQVDDLRSERTGRTVAFTQFLNDYKKDKVEIVYGFVEAKEDLSLYSSCIYNELPPECIIHLIPCSGKYKLRDTYYLIDWEKHSKHRICFFRDRDLSDYIEGDKDLCECENCYITDGYSIENSLITKKLFRRLLREVLGYQLDVYEVVEEVVEKFIHDKLEFEYQLKDVMAHIIYWKQKGLSSPLNTINIKDIVEISKDNIIYKDKEYRKNYIYSRAQVDITRCDMEEISSIESSISENERYRYIIRGHFLSDFFILYCNAVKKCTQMLSTKLDVNNIIAPRCGKIESLSNFVNNTYLTYYKQIGRI